MTVSVRDTLVRRFPRRSGWLPSRHTVVHEGIPNALASFVDRPQASAWYPHYDFETIRWQLGRCPMIESATILAEGAAAVIWHLHRNSDWQMVLFQLPGGEDQLPLVIGQAARVAWRRGGNILSTLVSKMDRLYDDNLMRQLYFKTDEHYPLYLFKPPEDPMPLINLQRLNGLATDLASIG